MFLLSWYKFYCVLARSRYKFDWSQQTVKVQDFNLWHWRSVAVQIVSKPENYHGAGFKLRADARVWMQEPLQNCLEGRSKAKTVTNNLPILSVLYVGLVLKLS